MSDTAAPATRLQTYLHDHLAGAEAGLQLATRLVERHAGTSVGAALAPVRDGIAEDREALRAIVAAVGHPSHTWKEAAGWLAERLARLKLEAGTDAADPFALFEALEALALGILGKRSLWQALLASGLGLPAGLDLAELIARADRQHAVVEGERRTAALRAFAVPS
jgi:hypothetical protein